MIEDSYFSVDGEGDEHDSSQETHNHSEVWKPTMTLNADTMMHKMIDDTYDGLEADNFKIGIFPKFIKRHSL